MSCGARAATRTERHAAEEARVDVLRCESAAERQRRRRQSCAARLPLLLLHPAVEGQQDLRASSSEQSESEGRRTGRRWLAGWKGPARGTFSVMHEADTEYKICQSSLMRAAAWWRNVRITQSGLAKPRGAVRMQRAASGCNSNCCSLWMAIATGLRSDRRAQARQTRTFPVTRTTPNVTTGTTIL
eukprot:6190885-Pleurochrysis_carterae.AAC.2